MKKRLEAELISIAHRILKLKNHSELKQLHLETQKLYETLSVLKFVGENINIINPKIDVEDMEQKLEKFYDNPNENLTVENVEILIKDKVDAPTNVEIAEEKLDTCNKVEISGIANNEIIEAKIPEIQQEMVAVANDEIVEEEVIIEENEPIFVPEFNLEKQEKILDKKPEPVQISFDEFKFVEPVFEKKSDIKLEKLGILNEKLSKGINIGLNDKIAFVKHLFGESNEDYNRVLSQISTFDSYFETVNFINDFVKPDYNNWNDKDEYVLRFMEVVEKKFV